MSETRITLPHPDEMLARLKAVEDHDHLVEKFYPLLTKNAGQVRVPMGIVMMLQLAIADYTKGMPPVIASFLNMRMEEYIDALVMDEGAAAEAKEKWTTVMERMKAR